MRQTAYLDQLHEKADTYLQQLGTQRAITILMAVIILIITTSAVIIIMNMRRRHRLERQAFSMVVNVPAEENTPTPVLTEVTQEEKGQIEADNDARF